MADKKISELTAVSSLAGTEVLPVVQSSTTKKATVANVLGSLAFTDWTPQISSATTSPTLSDDASHIVEGRYCQIGELVIARGQVKAGTSGVNAGSGTYRLHLPVTAAVPANATLGGATIGQGSYFNSATGEVVGVGVATGTESSSGLYGVFIQYDLGANIKVNHATPFALAASNEFEFLLMYEAA